MIGGRDPKDPFTRPVKRYRLAKRLLEAPSRKPLRGVVVGVPAPGDYFLGVPNDEQLAAFDAAVDVVKRQGATVREVTTAGPDPRRSRSHVVVLRHHPQPRGRRVPVRRT